MPVPVDLSLVSGIVDMNHEIIIHVKAMRLTLLYIHLNIAIRFSLLIVLLLFFFFMKYTSIIIMYYLYVFCPADSLFCRSRLLCMFQG